MVNEDQLPRKVVKLIALIVQVFSAVFLLALLLLQYVDSPGTSLGHYPWWCALIPISRWLAATLIKKTTDGA